MKNFAQRSSAVRAAKKLGLGVEQLGNFIVDNQTNASFDFDDVAAAAFVAKVDASLAPVESNLETQLDAAIEKGDAAIAEHTHHRAGDEVANAALVAESTEGNKKAIKRDSDIERPCKQVWHIADEMVGAKRKDIIAACVAAGIAYYTARTQYQQWYALEENKNKVAEAKRAAATPAL